MRRSLTWHTVCHIDRWHTVCHVYVMRPMHQPHTARSTRTTRAMRTLGSRNTRWEGVPKSAGELFGSDQPSMPAVIEELVLPATAFTVQNAHAHENQVRAPLHRLHRNNHSWRQAVD